MVWDGEDLVEIEDVEVLRATDKALLCIFVDREVWIPREQIDESSEVQDDGDAGILIIPQWLAKKEGLI